ncbi:MAG TPA: non-canonical purine NTP pyrophosphatase [Gaiellaceae bacterium]
MTARLASQNPNKARELAHALPGWRIELLEGDPLPAETGSTYYENALAKARFGHRAGEWTLGEDSGIEVDALGGAPGLHSARWAADGVAELLEELRSVTDRRARYVCELVALAPDGREYRGTGILEGGIAEVRRGSEGFGYDPIFVPDGEERTVAELGNDWKGQNSHRARAAHALQAAIGVGAFEP